MKSPCEVCGEIKDETDVVLYKDMYVCSDCMVTIKEDEEIDEVYKFIHSEVDAIAMEDYEVKD